MPRFLRVLLALDTATSLSSWPLGVGERLLDCDKPGNPPPVLPEPLLRLGEPGEPFEEAWQVPPWHSWGGEMQIICGFYKRIRKLSSECSVQTQMSAVCKSNSTRGLSCRNKCPGSVLCPCPLCMQLFAQLQALTTSAACTQFCINKCIPCMPGRADADLGIVVLAAGGQLQSLPPPSLLLTFCFQLSDGCCCSLVTCRPHCRINFLNHI